MNVPGAKKIYPAIEEVEKLLRESDGVLSEYKKERKPKPFTGGKVKYREYTSLIENMSELIDKAENNLGIESTCRRGCAACCTHPIVANGFEVEAILNYIERNYDHETVQAIKERIRKVASRLDAEFGPAPQTASQMLQIAKQEEEIKAKYFALQIPCPLLNEQQECMVYPVRPSPCWVYRSYGDPNVCKTTFDVPHTINYIGHEDYYMKHKDLSYDAKTIPKSESYIMTGFLPQKLRDRIR